MRKHTQYVTMSLLTVIIDKVDVGTFFGANLNWSSKTDHLLRFFLRNHFIRSMIFPIITYNNELWYNLMRQAVKTF